MQEGVPRRRRRHRHPSARPAPSSRGARRAEQQRRATRLDELEWFYDSHRCLWRVSRALDAPADQMAYDCGRCDVCAAKKQGGAAYDVRADAQVCVGARWRADFLSSWKAKGSGAEFTGLPRAGGTTVQKEASLRACSASCRTPRSVARPRAAAERGTAALQPEDRGAREGVPRRHLARALPNCCHAAWQLGGIGAERAAEAARGVGERRGGGGGGGARRRRRRRRWRSSDGTASRHTRRRAMVDDGEARRARRATGRFTLGAGVGVAARSAADAAADGGSIPFGSRASRRRLTRRSSATSSRKTPRTVRDAGGGGGGSDPQPARRGADSSARASRAMVYVALAIERRLDLMSRRD